MISSFTLGRNRPRIRAPVQLGVTFLAPKTFRLDHGDALKTDLLESLFHLVELEGFDDGFDLLHGPLVISIRRAGPGGRPPLLTPRPKRGHGVLLPAGTAIDAKMGSICRFFDQGWTDWAFRLAGMGSVAA
jgi:hypothetical protein